ncbi:hypothetical protein OSH08_21595 [Kaistia geumhonensis]|uniref:DoxX family protein n=1 Tax=Kaistia geumhonensis TaxID=410839 RepID=A0ABU0MCI6_9HYPH|nr:hypothetical protein [Kaistia geumhonensis]MCX5481607.1 hypothetical protein [Kaistia geumhonensis]MDQ0518674.1 hypothetical protein [Kaistia geumhonensis]
MGWILPPQIDNRFPGRRLVVAVFALITAMTIGRSLVHMFAPDGGAQSVAHIPLDTYPAAASNAVVFLFSFWGLSQLMMGLVYIVALLRYRALIPLLLVLIFVEYAGRITIGHIRVIETTATAPGAILDYVMVLLTLVLLVLSRPSSAGR